jgi:hypothetical protein
MRSARSGFGFPVATQERQAVGQFRPNLDPLALNPGFTIRRYRAGAQSDNPVFLKGRERIIEDMRKAGVPEG